MCPEEIFKRRNFRIKISFLNQFFNLSWWFSGSWRKIPQISPKLHSTCPDYRFVKKLFWSKEFQHFQFFREKPQDFGGKVSKGYFWANKFCIYIVIRIIYWIWERKFQTFPKNLPAELSKQHSTYPEDEFRERNCFWKYRIPQFSPTWRRTFRTVSDKFLAGFSFKHFAYPKGGFGRDSCLQSGLHNHGLQ